MREVFILCVKIEGENFCNAKFGINFEDEYFQPITSLNFLHNNNGKATIEFANGIENYQRFQGKRAEIFYYNNITGKIGGQKIIIYKISNKNNKITLECTGLEALLEFGQASFFSINCRANFGDKACKADIKTLGIEGVIDSFDLEKNEIYSTNLKIINPKIYENGKLLVDKSYFIVLQAASGVIKILNEARFKFTKDSQFVLISGCDKSLKCCREVHKNAINFQGEPFIFEKFSNSSF